MMDEPVTEKVTLRGSSENPDKALVRPTQFRYGVSGMQGWRADMEDAHICGALPVPGHGLFCVLDGHGGTEASHFARDELTRLLCDTPEWQTYVQTLATSQKNRPVRNGKAAKDRTRWLERALVRAFVELDRELFLENHYGEEPGASSAGSTAVLLLLTPLELLCANIGDCRCLVGSSSTASPWSVTAHPLSEDHTPDLEPEQRRILRAGGTVVLGRVDGELAVSRAFGDFELKDVEGLQQQCDPTDPDDVERLLGRARRQKVTAVPEVRSYQRNDTTDRFLVLACDGVWDVVSNEDCVEWIAALLQNGNCDLGLVCEELLDKCLQLGSQDNMTIVIVLLEAGQKLIGKASRGVGQKSH